MKITANQLRQRYISFFVSKGHVEISSASLIPENDPTTLFTGSGMQPMVPYLLGEPHPTGTRVVDSQKCFRSQDIEEVGDNRHTTFFEMLGNWSLGDYFKKEQVEWMFEFLIREVKLDPRRLYVTVFRGNEQVDRDEETAGLWQKAFASVEVEARVVDFAERDGMQGGRIFYYDETKNWWSRSGLPKAMPVGEPGGPDTEMFWDFGAERQLHEHSSWKDQPCHVNCDCGRFMEIGNNVFMQYKKTATGFEPLPKQNVDFGGGLERIAAAVNDTPDVFSLDVFSPVIAFLEEQTTGQKYDSHPSITNHMRIVADHTRAATFLIADGVSPSNKDQGYVLRRLLRRAIVHMHKLEIEPMKLTDVSRFYIQRYQEPYPLLAEREQVVLSVILEETKKFSQSVAQGERELERMITSTGAVSPKDAFLLYQSYGFPWELTYEMTTERGIAVDRNGFEQEFEKHKQLSRSGSEQKFAGGLADHSEESKKLHTATHLLHKALRMVLGDRVAQKGSNITAQRLRFDFSHDKKMTVDEIRRVEEIVNEQIQAALPMGFTMMTVEEAKAAGAIGLFEDTYAQVGGKVKVYTAGDDHRVFSREICGGPHVDNTGVLEAFAIQKEEASSAGIRRIKAVVGPAARVIWAGRKA